MKSLILYAYCEFQIGPLANQESVQNLTYFLNHGIINNIDYQYIININGKYKFDFSPYLKKHSNLQIINGDGKCQLDGWNNIISNFDTSIYNSFFFFTDKVMGPFNKNKISINWIEYFNSYLDKYPVIINGYGTSPWGKLYTFPYYTMKFFAVNKKTFEFLIKNQIFTQLSYNTQDGKFHQVENIREIKLSKIFLENNIKYVYLDINGIHDLNIIKLYQNKKWKVLQKITENLHQVNDMSIVNRFFWTGNCMKKIFIDKDKNFIQKLKNKRNTQKLKTWY